MTFVEALGGHNGETVFEKLGGHNGDMLHKIMADKEIEVIDKNPLSKLAMDFNIAPDMDLFGKVVGDLQSNMAVSNNAITGNLNYVTDYTGFSSKEEEQKGNYMAMHFSIPNMTIGEDGLNVAVNGSNLDSDGVIVLIMKTLNPITIVATKGGDEFQLTLDPSNVVCESAPVVEETPGE